MRPKPFSYCNVKFFFVCVSVTSYCHIHSYIFTNGHSSFGGGTALEMQQKVLRFKRKSGTSNCARRGTSWNGQGVLEKSERYVIKLLIREDEDEHDEDCECRCLCFSFFTVLRLYITLVCIWGYVFYILYQYVTHKSVAEVSKIGNL